MIAEKLKKLQFCLDGGELASNRLEYYKTYGLIFEHPPKKLKPFLEIKEDIEILGEEYLDLFVRSNPRYVFPFSSAHKKGKSQFKLSHPICLRNTIDEKPLDHIIFCLSHMCSLIKREKQQWQRKKYIHAMDILQEEQSFLFDQLDWLPNLCHQIQKNSTSHFYNQVGANLINFFYLEKLLLEIIIKERETTFS